MMPLFTPSDVSILFQPLGLDCRELDEELSKSLFDIETSTISLVAAKTFWTFDESAKHKGVHAKITKQIIGKNIFVNLFFCCPIFHL